MLVIQEIFENQIELETCWLKRIHFWLTMKDTIKLGYLNQLDLCLQVCLTAKENRWSWYLDSGCSRPMTDDKDLFDTLETKERGVVTFGDNDKGHIIRIGKV